MPFWPNYAVTTYWENLRVVTRSISIVLNESPRGYKSKQYVPNIYSVQERNFFRCISYVALALYLKYLFITLQKSYSQDTGLLNQKKYWAKIPSHLSAQYFGQHIQIFNCM